MADTELLTVREVARLLRVTERTVLAYIYKGKIPTARRLTWGWRIRREDVEPFMVPAERGEGK